MKKKGTNMFELPPKCPALADKITGIFGWRHTYQVHQRQKGIPHGNQYLYKSYSLNLPRKASGSGGVAASTATEGETRMTGGSGGGGSPSYISDRQYRHQQHHQVVGNGSCCVTEPGTPNCEINPDSWVVVHHLQSQSGILDPEDHISDVADDREEIIASYEDAGVGLDPGVPQGGGDGASGSSVGTGSPDIFQAKGPVVVGGVVGGGVVPGQAPSADVVAVVESVDGNAGVGAGHGCDSDVVLMVAGGSAGVVGAEEGSSSCIEVTANEAAPLGLGLQVRRGSEPSLHQIGVTDQRSPLYNVNPNGHNQETSKRWSAAPVCRSDSDPPPERLLSPQHQNGGGGVGSSPYHYHLLSPEWNVPEEDPQQQQAQAQLHDTGSSLLPQAFNRSGRLSMQFLGAEATTGYRWMDAAEKAAAAAASAPASASTHNQSASSPSVYQPYMQYMQQQHLLQHSFHHSGAREGGIDGGDRGPETGNSSGRFSSKSLPRESTRKEPLGQAKASVYDSLREKDSEMLLVVNETGGPLGLTAIPDKDRGGLLVQSVEPGSRAERGRLRWGDRILEINNIKLVGLSESSVQEHLRKSLASTELRLRVVRGAGGAGGAATAGAGTRDSGSKAADFAGRLVTGGSGSRYRRDNRVGQMMIEAEEQPTSAAKVATVSPTRKMPGAPSTASSLQVANTRKLGKRIEITLTKGDHGLGFSVTTRDNPAGGHCPIYIKNILPKGAAVEDGRLKPGDRLLEVEGVPMTGKSQTEVVSILRGTPHGATLNLVVSRQQELTDAKEREIGFSVESEPKNSLPKPPPPVLPKSSLRQSTSSNSLASHAGGGVGVDEGRGAGVSNSRSLQKLSSGSSTPSSPKTPTAQKKPLTSILKSASSNHVAELLMMDSAMNDGVGDREESGAASGVTLTNGGGGGSGGTLSGAAWKNREILTLHIPVHDTEKAGLGVSVKGKTGSGNSTGGSGGSGSSASRTDGDLGIFVKSVLHGGAASRDGRLKMNDQLLSVNGVSLLGQSNAEAMETLRRAMLQSGGSYPGKIILTVARRIGRPVSTGELLEALESQGGQHQSGAASAGTTVIYLSADRHNYQEQQQQGPAMHRPPPGQDSGELKLQQSKRYSNPVLDRLTGGTGSGSGSNSNTATSLQHTCSQPLMMGGGAGSNDALTSGGHFSHGSHSSSSGNVNNYHLHQPQPKQQQPHHYPHNQRPSALRPIGGGGGGPSAAPSRGAASVVQTPPAHGLRNESYYLATGEHWSATSSATSLNGSNAVLIEEDPEPTSPTFHLSRSSEDGGAIVGAGSVEAVRGVVALGSGNTSTPNGADATYASQLSLETNPPSSDAFSRDAIGRRSMSEKHHAAMDARETGTYQRNKKLREERERDSKLLMLGSTPSGASGGGGSMESISHQMARLDSTRHGAGGHRVGAAAVAGRPTTALVAAHLLRDEAQDQLGDLGPSLGMKKSSSLESLQTMVQEIQMADEPRGPNALRTPRGRGREEILRAAVEQPPETQAKKHWLLEEGPSASSAPTNSAHAACELPDGGFVSRNSPFQSSLNDGKGAKLRAKKSGGLLRGIGHMFRFGKHRKDGIAQAAAPMTTVSAEPVADYTGSGGVVASHHHHHGANAWMNDSTGSGAGGGGSQRYNNNGPNPSPASLKGGAAAGTGSGNGTTISSSNSSNNSSSNNSSSNNVAAAAASRYIMFDPNSVERSASSGIAYGHHQQPPHYQPPPPPPAVGGATCSGSGGTSIHHTDVFNHRYSHYVNYEELQQQIRYHTHPPDNHDHIRAPANIYTAPPRLATAPTVPSNVGGDANVAWEQQCPPHQYEQLYYNRINEEYTLAPPTSIWSIPSVSFNVAPDNYREEVAGPLLSTPNTPNYNSAEDSSSSTSGSSANPNRERSVASDYNLVQLYRLQQLQRLEWVQQLQQLREYEQNQLELLRNSLLASSSQPPQDTPSLRSWSDGQSVTFALSGSEKGGRNASQDQFEGTVPSVGNTNRDEIDSIDSSGSQPNFRLNLSLHTSCSMDAMKFDHNDNSNYCPYGDQQYPNDNEDLESRRHHHYHSQRSARNTPPVGDISLLVTAQQNQQQQQLQQSYHHHHQASLLNQSHPQQKYKSARPASSYYDSAGGGYETISSIGPVSTGSSTHRKGGAGGSSTNAGSSGSTNNHTLLTVSSSSSSINSKANGNVLREENAKHLHHHAAPSGTAGGGSGVTTGSMRNTRGPFVTQVKIQNQMSYQ